MSAADQQNTSVSVCFLIHGLIDLVEDTPDLGSVDKVDSHMSRSMIQAFFYGGCHGSWFDVRCGMGFL